MDAAQSDGASWPGASWAGCSPCVIGVSSLALLGLPVFAVYLATVSLHPTHFYLSSATGPVGSSLPFPSQLHVCLWQQLLWVRMESFRAQTAHEQHTGANGQQSPQEISHL